MQEDSRSYKWEIARIRLRSWGYTLLQLGAFGIMFVGAFNVLGPRLIKYYSQRGGVPDLLSTAAETIPVMDEVAALVVFGIGAFFIHYTTS